MNVVLFVTSLLVTTIYVLCYILLQLTIVHCFTCLRYCLLRFISRFIVFVVNLTTLV